jgi:hypothetical protein
MASKKREVRPLLRRETTDANFLHCLRMLPALRMWAQGIAEGDRLAYNDVNMVHIPIEVLEALLRREVEMSGPLAEVCAEVLAQMAQYDLMRAGLEGQSHGE